MKYYQELKALHNTLASSNTSIMQTLVYIVYIDSDYYVTTTCAIANETEIDPKEISHKPN